MYLVLVDAMDRSVDSNLISYRDLIKIKEQKQFVPNSNFENKF